VLKSIDVLIGLVVVLLALSMAVTVITQAITTIINSRGKHLLRGLTDLLQQLDPNLNKVVSETVATKLLTHPLVCGSNTPLDPGTGLLRRVFGGRRYGNVVHREEFTKLLMHLASDGSAALDDKTLTALKEALKQNGIPDPKTSLKEIRLAALRLEQISPEVAHGVRQNIAIMQKAESEFVAKINNWYDQTMDRTSQRFTASTRTITFVGAFIVAFGLQVDTLLLANRLSADEKLRDAFVAQAIDLNKDRLTAPPTGTPEQTPDQKAAQANEVMLQRYRSSLSELGIITLPSADPGGWWKSFKRANYFGLLITALLLSLGAPFWYSALSGLLRLRSALAVKDDNQRKDRQSSEAPGSAGTASGGERGNMLAVG
jgi:hypothetical protein